MIGLGSDKKLAGGGGGWISSRSGWLLELLTELTKDPRNACSTSTLPWLKLHCSKGMDKSCVPYILIISLLTERIPSLCWRAKQTWARQGKAELVRWEHTGCISVRFNGEKMHFKHFQENVHTLYTMYSVFFYCSSLRKKKTKFCWLIAPCSLQILDFIIFPFN